MCWFAFPRLFQSYNFTIFLQHEHNLGHVLYPPLLKKCFQLGASEVTLGLPQFSYKAKRSLYVLTIHCVLCHKLDLWIFKTFLLR